MIYGFESANFRKVAPSCRPTIFRKNRQNSHKDTKKSSWNELPRIFFETSFSASVLMRSGSVRFCGAAAATPRLFRGVFLFFRSDVVSLSVKEPPADARRPRCGAGGQRAITQSHMKFKEYKGLDLAAVADEVLARWDRDRTFEKSLSTREVPTSCICWAAGASESTRAASGTI